MTLPKTLTKRTFREVSSPINPYANIILEEVNNHCLRLAVIDREYRWHYHTFTDELFIVLEGELKIELEGGKTLRLGPGEFVKIPAKQIHKTSATARTVNLTFERKGGDTVFIE
jgi:mannose-6-phosphate isomerase-like protein (cupin superfamily)